MLLSHAVLLDLDNTLININMRQFIPAYLAALGRALRRFAPPEEIAETVLYATNVMQANTNPATSNYNAFYKIFLAKLQVEYAEIQPDIDRFYREDYAKLRRYVSPKPQARELAAFLTASGRKVVIATHPIFPLTAIEQRMEWGNLSGLPYALVTAMETAHFSKPNPAYYQEILDRLGVAPSQALMVGDDPQNDIAPARQLGLETWQITNSRRPPVFTAANHQGSLAEFYKMMKTNDQ